ncbi:MAG: calcium/sodium antiporter [Kofleriaceae bacterium]
MLTLDLIRLAIGLVVLYAGAEALVRGSASMARAFGVKPLIIGLTVVAYGTSAPELAVSTKAALDHAQPIALGNVIGACAANISLVLGLTALIAPPTVDRRLIRREVPILLASVIAVPLCLLDGVISRVEGGLLVACAVMFTIATLTFSARDVDLGDDEEGREAALERLGAAVGGRARPRASRAGALVLASVGLLLIVVGSDQFVAGARGLAAEVGLSERLLGLTVIALGTSLPELIASLAAATRHQSGLAVGSVIGSNLLNVFLVLGLVAYLRPIGIGDRVHAVDVIGLLVITLLGVVVLRGSRTISRAEGLMLIGAYLAFLVCAAIF